MKTLKMLYDEVASDAALREEFLALADLPREERKAGLLAFAAAHGCERTEAELAAFAEGLAAGGELSEEELDLVAGGKSPGWSILMSLSRHGAGCDVDSGISEAVSGGGCNDFFVA